MKQFNRFVNEGFKIPEKDLDDLIMKTFSIVNDDVKNRLKNEKEIEQGNMHLEILSLLKKEWDDRSVLPEFVFRVTDNIFKMHKNKELSVQ
jgi:hypothetical protein|tara:strand:+ start:32 stop:304 length:273 start_codon:yes stop_codon:yes gene_type:complete